MTTNGYDAQQAVLAHLRDEIAAAGLADGLVPELEHSWRDLDIDSIDTIEIASAMEDRLGIEIPDERLRAIGGVADMVAAIVELQGASGEGAPA